MDNTLNNILTTLEIYSQIPMNGRIHTSKASISISKDSYWDKLHRFFMEDRESNVRTIERDINVAITWLNKTIEADCMTRAANTIPVGSAEYQKRIRYLHEIKNVTDKLETGINGISNLQTTYKDDVPINSRILTVINSTNSLIKDYRDFLEKNKIFNLESSGSSGSSNNSTGSNATNSSNNGANVMSNYVIDDD